MHLVSSNIRHARPMFTVRISKLLPETSWNRIRSRLIRGVRLSLTALRWEMRGIPVRYDRWLLRRNWNADGFYFEDLG